MSQEPKRICLKCGLPIETGQECWEDATFPYHEGCLDDGHECTRPPVPPKPAVVHLNLAGPVLVTASAGDVIITPVPDAYSGCMRCQKELEDIRVQLAKAEKVLELELAASAAVQAEVLHFLVTGDFDRSVIASVAEIFEAERV